MKKFLILLSMLFCFTAYAQTETLNWYIGDDVYATTQCESGNDILLPTTPTKRGYTFKGWAGYIPIEYLESTGTQYIDTGVRQSDYYKNLIMSAKFQFTNHDLENGFVAGCADSSRSQYYVPFGYDGRNAFLSNLGGGSTEILMSPFDINIHTVIANSAESFVKLDSILYTINSNITNIPYNIYLFGRNNAGTTVYSKVRIYNLSFSTNNGIKIRDFIPVLDGNGTPCMYDKVEGKFYYNAGTGQFIAGPIVGSGE